jgi:predicted nucleic acid-binding protein
MAALEQKKKFALDTNVLLDLAADKDFAHTFREVFQQKGYVLMAPPTAVQELAFAAINKTGEDQRLAHRALSCMREWGISPFDLMPVGHGITEQFTRRLTNRGLLPEEEVNDGQILAEASLANIAVLATADHHLLDIDEADLLAAFSDSDLPPVRPFHPKSLLKAVKVK